MQEISTFEFNNRINSKVNPYSVHGTINTRRTVYIRFSNTAVFAYSNEKRDFVLMQEKSYRLKIGI